MQTHSPNNERIKRQYLIFLKEAKRHSEATLDAVAKAMARFEADTKLRDFRTFHFEQAIAFKKRLAEQNSKTTGEKLSKATLHATLAHLKRFFQWLSGQPGYKSRLRYSDADYFNLSDKDTRVATARREKTFPTIEQVKHVIAKMPGGSDIERRNRALIAFTLLTGARDSAIASVRLKHVDLAVGSVYQDAREVNTKYSKTFTTFFFPVGDEIHQIVSEWVIYLREVKLWGNDDPLFPSTQIIVGSDRHFEVAGLKREHWSSAAPIRTIFREAFQAAGLPYFNPHSLRDTLAHFGEALCLTPEQFKALSQNLGHEGVLTTFYSYGEVGSRRQGEIIHSLAESGPSEHSDVTKLLKTLMRELRSSGPVR
ncbi:MAG: tyrosine-type recombinase/integrase [Gammaproteobacteria bacterium]|nr:tyrosine-type recombinase/integrase [Gammaproteobacteria bacterium]MBU2477908.1 tyrosine-type recombinase/integrase [Gammaproteobacteria bacterium]